MLLRVYRRPDNLSDIMPIFFAHLLPYFALIWSLGLLLFYDRLYLEVYGERSFERVAGPFAVLLLAIIIIILPMKTLIKWYVGKTRAEKDDQSDYNVVKEFFPTTYNLENPATKYDGSPFIETVVFNANQEEEENEYHQDEPE